MDKKNPYIFYRMLSSLLDCCCQGSELFQASIRNTTVRCMGTSEIKNVLITGSLAFTGAEIVNQLHNMEEWSITVLDS